MNNFNMFFVLLSDAVKDKKGPGAHLLVQEYGQDPYLVLISCLLSLRTRDAMMLKVSRELFKYIQKPTDLMKLERSFLENLLRPVGFYVRKTTVLYEVSQALLDKYDGKVPCDKDQLLSLPGVGLKTANLVLSEAFDIPAICVDTHVHRLSNMAGLIHTRTPEETEHVLNVLVPDEHKRTFSRYMVLLGQSPKKFQKYFLDKWDNYKNKNVHLN